MAASWAAAPERTIARERDRKELVERQHEVRMRRTRA